MGVEAMIESTDDKVCCVGVEDDNEDEFAAPNSASVLYSEISLSRGLAMKKKYLENLNVNGVHRHHKRNQGICNSRLVIEDATGGSWSGFLVSISRSMIDK